MRFDLKNRTGGIRTRMHIGPELSDDVRIVQRVNDDQVVELTVDDHELLALKRVVDAMVAARATPAAPPAQPSAAVANGGHR